MEQGPKVPSDITANQDVPGLPQADETDQHLSRLSSLDHVWAAHLRGNDPLPPDKENEVFQEYNATADGPVPQSIPATPES